MSDVKLKSRDFLQLFDITMQKGVKLKDAHEYHGIKASHDVDGYTCWLTYKDLTITLLFHGKLAVDFKNKATLDEFSTITRKILPFTS
ncbi:DUF3081 family protein [Colwelliaceae bacterium 6441]